MLKLSCSALPHIIPYSWTFSWIGRIWIFTVNIFTVVSVPWPRPLLSSVANARDPGIKIFTVNIFADCD